MTDNHLASEIVQNLNLLPNQFQLYLQKKYQNQPVQTCETIARLLFEDIERLSKISSRRKEQRQKLATSFNFLIEKSFKINDKNPELWNIYVKYVATREERQFAEEITQWKIYKILQKSFMKFVQTFQEEFTPIFQNLYFKLNLTHKILLQSLTHSDIDQQSLILFLTETLPEYIHLGHQQLQKMTKLNEEQTLQFFDHQFSQYLTNLYDSLKYLNFQSRDGSQCQYFLNRICEGEDLFGLVYQCIIMEVGPEGNPQNRGNQIKKIFNFSGTYHKQQSLHNIKALGLQTFSLILSRYSRKSTAVEFDQSKPLNLMQNLVPSLITELSQIKTNNLTLNCNQKLTISCLNLIRKSITFLFMNNWMWNQYQDIFWRILFPMLSLSDEEVRQYHDDPDLFINQNQTLVEKEEDDDDKIESCKTYAGFLIDTLTQYIDGALSKITNGIILILQSQLQIHTNIPEQLQQILKTYNIKQSSEACLTILQILTSKIKRRSDILKKLRYIFIQYRDRVMQLKGIDKCRVILFLCYNFDDVMKIENGAHVSVNEKQKQRYLLSEFTEEYYYFIANSIGQSQPITKSCLSFYQTYYKLEPKSKIILTHLINQIQSTKSLDIFQTILCTLNQTIDTLSFTQIKDLLQKCLNRIFQDNDNYMRSIKNSQVYSNICMIKCMYIVRMVGLEARNLDQPDGQVIMGVLWRVFDLFQFVYEVNYGEELIKIFDAMLSFVKVIDGPLFYQYLPNFAEYHRKQKQIGRLFYTYYALLTKGYEYLSTHEQQTQKFLSQIIQNIMIIIRYCYRNRSMIAIVLLQYILIKFPNVVYSHEEIYVKTKEILELQTNLSKENVAAVYNLWIIGSVHDDVYNLGLLDQYYMEDVYGYHAKVFAFAIYKKIQQLCKHIKNTDSPSEIETNLQKITYLLKKTTCYLKHQSQSKTKNSKIEYKIHQFAEINSNQKIRSIFIMLKNSLIQADYTYVMAQLEKQVSREELKRLLDQIVKESRVIFKFKAK